MRYPYKRNYTTICAECHEHDVGWFTAPISKTQYCILSEPYSTQKSCLVVTSLAPQCPINSYCDYATLSCIE